MKVNDFFESASCGSTSAGSIASVNSVVGGAQGFTRDMSASIYHGPNGIKTHRKKKKAVKEGSYIGSDAHKADLERARQFAMNPPAVFKPYVDKFLSMGFKWDLQNVFYLGVMMPESMVAFKYAGNPVSEKRVRNAAVQYINQLGLVDEGKTYRSRVENHRNYDKPGFDVWMQIGWGIRGISVTVMKSIDFIKKEKEITEDGVLNSTKGYYEPNVLRGRDKMKPHGPVLGGNPNKREKPINKKFVGCSQGTEETPIHDEPEEPEWTPCELYGHDFYEEDGKVGSCITCGEPYLGDTIDPEVKPGEEILDEIDQDISQAFEDYLKIKNCDKCKEEPCTCAKKETKNSLNEFTFDDPNSDEESTESEKMRQEIDYLYSIADHDDISEEESKKLLDQIKMIYAAAAKKGLFNRVLRQWNDESDDDERMSDEHEGRESERMSAPPQLLDIADALRGRVSHEKIPNDSDKSWLKSFGAAYESAGNNTACKNCGGLKRTHVKSNRFGILYCPSGGKMFKESKIVETMWARINKKWNGKATPEAVYESANIIANKLGKKFPEICVEAIVKTFIDSKKR